MEPTSRSAAEFALLLGAPGGVLRSTIEGGSMGPSLPPGTEIAIRAVPASALVPGEIVAFLRGERLVAHRLVRVGRSSRARAWALTRGDASRWCDAPIPLALILGVVTPATGSSRPPAGFPTFLDRLAGWLFELSPRLLGLARRVVGRVRRL